MVKILLWLCLFMVVIGLWKVVFKIYIHRHFQHKKIQQGKKLNRHAVTSAKKMTASEMQARVVEIEEYEQQLFDDICQIFFERQLAERNLIQAVMLQEEVFRKMPAKTQTQVRKLDLSEWSIYWGFYDQSLEYYVGRYGIFYTHVDRFGQEHKVEIKSGHHRA